MESFNVVPMEDIDYLLINNNLSTTGNKYLTAWNFILQNPNVLAPVSIADYVIAYNIFNEKKYVPVMNPYNIITSNYRLDDLNSERTIRIMKYLNKLDETDFFKDLPDEVIANIISNLDCEQIFSLCKISQRFQFICKNYKYDVYKNISFELKDFNPVILCKSFKHNRRSIYYRIFRRNYTSTIIVDNYGNVNILIKDLSLKTIVKHQLAGIENIISIDYYDNILYLLDSFGNVYTTNLINEDDGILLPSSSIKNTDHMNIIQICSNKYGCYLLSINGDVYKFGEKLPLLHNVVSIFRDEATTIIE
jgi:hypothetical protein